MANASVIEESLIGIGGVGSPILLLKGRLTTDDTTGIADIIPGNNDSNVPGSERMKAIICFGATYTVAFVGGIAHGIDKYYEDSSNIDSDALEVIGGTASDMNWWIIGLDSGDES